MNNISPLDSQVERQHDAINIHILSIPYWIVTTRRQHCASIIHKLTSPQYLCRIRNFSDTSGAALPESTYCMPYFHCLYTPFLSFSLWEEIAWQLHANKNTPENVLFLHMELLLSKYFTQFIMLHPQGKLRRKKTLKNVKRFYLFYIYIHAFSRRRKKKRQRANSNAQCRIIDNWYASKLLDKIIF